MSEKSAAENLLDRVVDSITESSSKQKSSFSAEEISESVTTQFNRLFGREKPVHHILGGGKSADVLLWRNKKISAGVLGGATAVWVVFEWLDYNFLNITSFILILGLLAQFIWSNASGVISSGRSHSKVPRLVLPEDIFVNISVSVGRHVNQVLGFLQDLAIGGNLKQLLIVIGSLWVAAILGSWFNFLTVLYLGFVGAHTLPVLYERYEDQVDNFVYQVLDQFQHHYRKLDKGVLSRIPKGKFKGKKYE
ncbi:hypothetical protein UlMin_013967 [Ulmus minor]